MKKTLTLNMSEDTSHFMSLLVQKLHWETVCYEWDEGGRGPDPTPLWAAARSHQDPDPPVQTCVEVQGWDLPASQEA